MLALVYVLELVILLVQDVQVLVAQEDLAVDVLLAPQLVALDVLEVVVDVVLVVVVHV